MPKRTGAAIVAGFFLVNRCSSFVVARVLVHATYGLKSTQRVLCLFSFAVVNCDTLGVAKRREHWWWVADRVVDGSTTRRYLIKIRARQTHIRLPGECPDFPNAVTLATTSDKKRKLE